MLLKCCQDLDFGQSPKMFPARSTTCQPPPTPGTFWVRQSSSQSPRRQGWASTSETTNVKFTPSPLRPTGFPEGTPTTTTLHGSSLHETRPVPLKDSRLLWCQKPHLCDGRWGGDWTAHSRARMQPTGHELV